MRPLIATLAVLGFLATLSLGIPTHAYADDCEEEDSKKKDGKNFHVEIRNGKKVYVIDQVITVCGKVPRPSVVYVLQARQINYEWESLKQDFLPKILASVKRAPF